MRLYEVDGFSYPSVTTILSPATSIDAMKQWAVNQTVEFILTELPRQENAAHFISSDDVKYRHKAVLKNAASKGTDCHSLIELYIKRKLSGSNNELSFTGYDNESVMAFNSFLAWEAEYVPIWIKTELAICDPKTGYAGTCDAVAIIDGIYTIIDFKTSNSLWDSHKMQIIAYKEAYNLTAQRKVEKMGLLRLDKHQVKYQWKELTATHDERQIGCLFISFLSLLDYWYHTSAKKVNNPIAKRIWWGE